MLKMRNRRKIVRLGIVIPLLILLILICLKNQQLLGLILIPDRSYQPTVIPSDTLDLFDQYGNPTNDKVYIFVQGGPNWKLFSRKQSPFAWMTDADDFIQVFPYQSQILNRSILFAKPTLTADQAASEVRASAEMLYRTIQYFKAREKQVYIFCLSHGSQIGLELLRHYPVWYDGLALTMIRLDIDQEAIEMIEQGKVPYFKENQDVESRNLVPDFLHFPRLMRRVENMTLLMKVSRNRYTELLSDKDLSKVVFVYGKYDNKVGLPKSHELEFLRQKGVLILELECGHDDLGSEVYIKRINELLLN